MTEPLDTLLKLDLTTPLKKPGASTARTFKSAELVESVLADLEAKGLIRRGADYFDVIAPTTGATTGSVKRTRTEFKFPEPIFLKDYTELLIRLKGELLAVNYDGDVVVLQLHCDDGNDPTIKGFYDNGDIKVGVRDYDETKDPDKVKLVNVGATPALLELEYRIRGNKLTVVCGHGESASRKEFTLTAGRLARPHVPHVGVYNQIDQGADTEPAGDRSALRIYEFYVGEAPDAAQPDLAQQLHVELDKLLQDYRSGAIALSAARIVLNDISTRIKAVEDADARYALNVKTAAVKAQLK